MCVYIYVKERYLICTNWCFLLSSTLKEMKFLTFETFFFRLYLTNIISNPTSMTINVLPVFDFYINGIINMNFGVGTCVISS